MTMYSYSYTTMHTYDKANQLVSSATNGKVTEYAYDATGRLIKEGDKSYAYGWLDKVLSVTENGQQIASFNYHNDGQIAQAIHDGKSEDFLWDGLALIHRGETSFINEPYVTGGNPVMAGDDVFFNDMLGSTLANNGKAVEMTSFGETADKNAFFTGKPMIDELGYSFLFRDYNPNQGKWTTTDPLGYPDGWNNLAYCNNSVYDIDMFGAWSFLRWLYTGDGNSSDDIYNDAVNSAADYLLKNYDNAHLNASANLITGVGGTTINLSVKYSIVNGAGIEFNVGSGIGFDISAGVSVGVTRKVVKSQKAILDIMTQYGFDVSVGGTFCFKSAPVGYYLLLSYNPTKGALTYDVGYGAGLTQVSGTANVSIDVIQKIVDNLEVHIKYTIKE